MITTLPAEEGSAERGKTEATATAGVVWDKGNDASASKGDTVPASACRLSADAGRLAEKIALELTTLNAKNTVIAPANEYRHTRAGSGVRAAAHRLHQAGGITASAWRR